MREMVAQGKTDLLSRLVFTRAILPPRTLWPGKQTFSFSNFQTERTNVRINKWSAVLVLKEYVAVDKTTEAAITDHFSNFSFARRKLLSAGWLRLRSERSRSFLLPPLGPGRVSGPGREGDTDRAGIVGREQRGAGWAINRLGIPQGEFGGELGRSARLIRGAELERNAAPPLPRAKEGGQRQVRCPQVAAWWQGRGRLAGRVARPTGWA